MDLTRLVVANVIIKSSLVYALHCSTGAHTLPHTCTPLTFRSHLSSFMRINGMQTHTHKHTATEKFFGFQWGMSMMLIAIFIGFWGRVLYTLLRGVRHLFSERTCGGAMLPRQCCAKLRSELFRSKLLHTNRRGGVVWAMCIYVGVRNALHSNVVCVFAHALTQVSDRHSESRVRVADFWFDCAFRPSVAINCFL